MSDSDLGNLKPILEAHEKFAKAIGRGDAGYEIARKMLAIIAEAAGSMHPSSDSTANYVPNRQIIEDLALLRREIEQLARKG